MQLAVGALVDGVDEQVAGRLARAHRTRDPRRVVRRDSPGVAELRLDVTPAGTEPYTFIADDSGGGCGNVPMPADATPEEVQTAIFTQLADLTRIFHGVEIDVEWSSQTPDSWVGHIRRVTTEEPAPPGAVPEVG
ncbi:hypothetical protein [Streptomyces sp. NPDC096030]|uniref:hypothetical protein n=1 Tax=Streptomyces sp. NPDC096030 TaxID=3155423 RepID=UPI00331D2E32